MLTKQVPLSIAARVPPTRAGATRASNEQSLNPVHAADPLKDPTSSEYRELQHLKQRDREVRQHEQAHIAAGGAYVRGGASFSYATGPDGQRYATGGEVKIDTSPVPGDPEATIRKMQAVRSAATAPAEPSAQDRAVAADAAVAEARSRTEVREQQDDDGAGETDGPDRPRARVQGALDAYRASAEPAPGRQPVLDLTA